tara:strand:+ start:36 stop:227 length:192 start_codon:yes stop_codon:yes gene_type:complete
LAVVEGVQADTLKHLYQPQPLPTLMWLAVAVVVARLLMRVLLVRQPRLLALVAVLGLAVKEGI